MKSSSHLENADALTNFLILDHLEKAGISPNVRNQLAKELGNKGLFQSLLTFEGNTARSSYEDLRSQLPTTKEPILRNIMYNQYRLNKQKIHSKQEVDTLIADVQKKYSVIDFKSRRKQLKRRSNSKRGYIPRTDYPSEIFTNYWNKYKSMFGHAKKDQDPDDPINGSPVYNLIYDKSGRHVISAADDGIIKIWSTANGELVNSFIGHSSDINATALSECGTYLASCSNDGIVRIWHLESGVPIAVFKDHAGVVCSLNFFSVPVYNKGQRKLKRGLASASDDGTIKIYFEEDFVNNGGVVKHNQKHLTLKVESTAANKGFSSIEFHPEGFIAAGTNWGSIVIWNKLSEIERKQSDRDRIIKNEHSKDCHLTLWNKDGTMLLSASFDGTAKVWPWNSVNFDANRTMSSIFIFDGELGRGTDIKCCAVAWSARGRYAIASFCKKIGKRNEEVSLIQSNIQIYDAKMNKRSHKFDKTYDGAAFENYIFILEPHPFNESILISADYDGKIIIWDIERGVMLNCFIENCAHMSCPLLQAPILDGRFSPDGLSFCVANYYGSVTLYGYGEKDLFMTTPTEQFYSKEFKEFEIDSTTLRVIALEGGVDMHLVGRGDLCSSKKRVYNPRPEILAGELEVEEEEYAQEFSIEAYYKKQLYAIDKLKYAGNQEAEGINSKECIKALKLRLHELAQQELEKVLENHYLENLKKRSTSIGIPGVPNFLDQHRDKLQFQIRKLHTREIEQQPLIVPAIQPAQQPVVSQNNRDQELAHAMQLEDEEEDYEPIGTNDRNSRNNRSRPRRTRRSRSARYNEEDYDDEDDFIPEDKEDEDEENELEEEEEEEENLEERAPRRLRKLILDEEGEEESHAQPQRYATRRTENRNNVSGRRNRQIINDAVNTREHHNLRGSTRATRPQHFEEELGDDIECARCGLENARVKCSGNCGKVYHSACSKRQGRESEYGGFLCLACLLKRRRSEKMKGAQVDRTWASSETPQKDLYVPQVGDLVTYVFQAHEDFILQYFDFLRFSKKEILPFEKRKFLLQDNVCRVTNIKYQFPLCPKKYRGHINILMKITLTVTEAPDLENIEEENKSFTFTYFPAEVGVFIFPRQMYLNSVNEALNLVKETQITVRYNGETKTGQFSEIEPREEGPYPDSHYGSLRVFDLSEEGGYSLRRNRRELNNADLLYISPWDVIYEDERRHDSLLYDQEKSQEMTEEFVERIRKDIEQLYELNQIRYVPFYEEVDKRAFHIYPSIIALEMNIQTILSRLSNIYYRHKEAIISDINIISHNCCKFNDKSALISILSLELANRMGHIVNGTLDPEILAKPTDDELLPLDEAEPAKFDQNIDLVQSLQQQKSLVEEENNNIPAAKHTNEEDHTNIPGMRLRPKRNVNFKNDDFGKDYDDFDNQNQVRRSTRMPHKKEDSDFVTYKPHQAFPAEPVHNSGYSTRLRTKRGETFEDHKEERKESLNIVLPREVIQRNNTLVLREKTVTAVEVTPPKQVENAQAGTQIKLRKAQTKTRSYQEKISGESFIIEAIEGGNLGWKGLEENSQKLTPVAVAAPVETNRNGRTRTSQRLNQSAMSNGPVEEKKEEEGYRVRLRRPGKSSVYKEDDFEDEEEEELDYGESEDDDEVVFNKKQKKQQNKQNKKQQIVDFNLAQQQTQGGYVEPQETAQETRVTRAKRKITEHYKTSNIDDAAEDPDETSTKIRLTLPPAGENLEAKRYNTRGQRR